MNLIRINLPIFHNLLNLSNYTFRGLGHIIIEVSGSSMEHQISILISFLSLNKGKVSKKGLFEETFLSIYHPDLFGLSQYLWNHAPIVKFYRYSSFLHQSINSSFCVKPIYPCSTTSYLLSQSSLRTELEFKVPIQVKSHVMLIKTHIGRNHPLYLFISNQKFKTPGMSSIDISSTSLIRCYGEISDRFLRDSIDEIHGYATESKTSKKKKVSISNTSNSLLRCGYNLIDPTKAFPYKVSEHLSNIVIINQHREDDKYSGPQIQRRFETKRSLKDDLFWRACKENMNSGFIVQKLVASDNLLYK